MPHQRLGLHIWLFKGTRFGPWQPVWLLICFSSKKFFDYMFISYSTSQSAEENLLHLWRLWNGTCLRGSLHAWDKWEKLSWACLSSCLIWEDHLHGHLLWLLPSCVGCRCWERETLQTWRLSRSPVLTRVLRHGTWRALCFVSLVCLHFSSYCFLTSLSKCLVTDILPA